jgi:phosphatidylserine synthase 2
MIISPDKIFRPAIDPNDVYPTSNILLERPFPEKKRSGFHFSITIVCFALFMVWAAGFMDTFTSTQAKLKCAYGLLNITLVALGLLVLPTPDYSSPLKYAYKLILSLGFVYSLNTIFVAFMDKDTAHQFLVFLDPSLANPLLERDYATDCRVYTPENPESKFYNISSAMDIFIIAHLIGWFFRALMFRNNLLVWTLSIMFEVYELTFRHWLPNFYECWWDHLFLDVFGCNMLGIFLANWLMNKLKVEKFHWFFTPTEQSESIPYLRRFWYSLTRVRPYVEKMEWHFLASVRNYLIVLWVIGLTSLADLSNFFNKKMLGIPPNHWILAIRIWICAFFCILATSDFYKYAQQPEGQRRASLSMYVTHFILIAEWTIFWRNYDGHYFETPTPTHVIVFWSALTTVLFGFGVYAWTNSRKKMVKQ